MTNDPHRFGIDQTEDLPDRIEHRRKIAERFALDSPEFAADDPSRVVDRTGSGYRAQEAVTDSRPRHHTA
jgi:hypothetical protein